MWGEGGGSGRAQARTRGRGRWQCSGSAAHLAPQALWQVQPWIVFCPASGSDPLPGCPFTCFGLGNGAASPFRSLPAANGHSAPFLPVMGQGAEVAMPERSDAKARHFVTAEGLGMITHRCGARRGWIYSRRTSFSCVLWCVGAVFVHACCVICRRKNKHGNLREGGGSSGARSRRRVRGLWSVTRFGTGDILGIRVACYNTFTLALYHSRILPVSPTHRDDLIR